ncbi:hypothetical protein LPJ53_000775 [Coemansia erecta]|uniref:B30.2/SPRY domain-containing protein n=1 Tax=Coemansia erecta TaxID=147472 RepID=A0A9W7Y4S2_9FUNG|nr:hypothetical protein LPJ53_000775 [Coemansia erecta]
MTDSSNSALMCLAGGVCAAVGTYRTLSHILDQSQYELEYCMRYGQQGARSGGSRRRNAWYGSASGGVHAPDNAVAAASMLASPTMVDSLGSLALRGATYAQRQAASDVVLDLAASSAETMGLLVDQARHGSAEERIRAALGVQALAQSHARLRVLERAGAVQALVEGLRQTESRELASRCAMALADVLGGEGGRAERRRARAVRRHGLAAALGDVLGRPRGQSHGAVAAVCVLLARQCTLDAALHPALVAAAVLPGLLAAARDAAADVEQLRAAMEAAVRLCTHVSAAGGPDALGGLVDAGAARVVGMCVRHDDQGVASWGIGLLHELASRGVARAQLAGQPRLVRALCRRLATGKYAYTNQLVLRSLWCLCASQAGGGRSLLDAVAEPHSLRRVLGVFAGGAAADDMEAQYWAVALVSRAATLPHTHRWILASPLAHALEALVHVGGEARGLRATLLPEIAALVARLAHEPASAEWLARAPHVVGACVALLRCRDVEAARVSAAMALVRAAATSQAFVRAVGHYAHAADWLREMADDAAHPGVQPYALKALAAVRRVPGAAALDEAAGRAAVAYLRYALGGGLHALRRVFCLPRAGDGSEAAAWTHRLASASVAASVACARATDAPVAMAAEDVRATSARVAALQMQMAAVAAGCTGHALVLPLAVPGYEDEAADADADAEGGLEAEDSRLPRACIAAIVRAYYGPASDDPHARAAAGDYAADDAWPSSRERLPVRGRLLGAAGAARARGFLAAVEPTLLALAEALADAGAALQDAEAARMVVWVMRIVYFELPLSMRALAVRVLAAIPPHVLGPADSAGVARMCAGLLWPAGEAAEPEPPGGEAACAGETWMMPFAQATGVSAGVCSLPRAKYYAHKPVLAPAPLALLGFVHARLALDQRISSAQPAGALLQRPSDACCAVLADGRTVWNSGWRFASVRALRGFDGRLGGVHSYEVQLLSSGLMQVGWCSERCGFFPESGEGVGDDAESLAYDGFRRRRWHAVAGPDGNMYGERWRAGDVIAAELDMDTGRATFFRNGRALGVALERPADGGHAESAAAAAALAQDRTWYPAFSFAGEQGLVFLGAGRGHPPAYTVEQLPSAESAQAEDAEDAGDDGDEEVGVDMLDVRMECLYNHRAVQVEGAMALCSLRFEFDALDSDAGLYSMPCVALPLPAALGELFVGPHARSNDDDDDDDDTSALSRWCVVHSLVPAPASAQSGGRQVAERFARALRDEKERVVELLVDVPLECRAVHLTFAAMPVGHVVVCATADAGSSVRVDVDVAGSRVSEDVWKAAAAADEYLWLPTVSGSVSRFTLDHLSN